MALDLNLGVAQTEAAREWSAETVTAEGQTYVETEDVDGASEESDRSGPPELVEVMCLIWDPVLQRYVAHRRENGQIRRLDPTEVRNICNEDAQEFDRREAEMTNLVSRQDGDVRADGVGQRALSGAAASSSGMAIEDVRQRRPDSPALGDRRDDKHLDKP